LLVGHVWMFGRLRGRNAYRALSMGSAILYDGMLERKVVRRGDVGTMCAAMWSAAAGAPVPNASKVGGSVVMRESDSKWPIAVSRPAEVDLTYTQYSNVRVSYHCA
jgi:hypothetical protein